MEFELEYGNAKQLTLAMSDEARLELCRGPDGLAEDQVVPAVRRGLAKPLGYPPLDQALVPGDRIAIPVARDTPRPELVLAGVVEALLEADVPASHIDVIQAADWDCRLLSSLSADVAEAVRVVTHDADDSSELAFLAPSSDAEPVYLSRAVCEADFVLPIGPVHLPGALGYRGPFGDVYPQLSDAKTIDRFRDPHLLTNVSEQTLRRRETNEVGWQLGSRLLVQVVPGKGGSIHQVVCGDLDSAVPAAIEQGEAGWRFELAGPAELVIASITGDAGQQTWDNVARAVNAALRVVDEQGLIVLCTELAARPGEAIVRLAELDDTDAALDDIYKLRSADAWAATMLARARAHGSVFLMSKLDEDLVEGLGIAYVASGTELARLAKNFPSCAVLEGAQYVVPSCDTHTTAEQYE